MKKKIVKFCTSFPESKVLSSNANSHIWTTATSKLLAWQSLKIKWFDWYIEIFANLFSFNQQMNLSSLLKNLSIICLHTYSGQHLEWTSSYISTFTQFFCCVHFISSWVLLWSCSALYTQGQDQGFIVGECSYTWLNMACLKGWSLTHLFRGDLPSWKQIHCTYSLALNVFSGSKLWPLHLSPSSVVSFGSSISIAAAGFLWHD